MISSRSKSTLAHDKELMGKFQSYTSNANKRIYHRLRGRISLAISSLRAIHFVPNIWLGHRVLLSTNNSTADTLRSLWAPLANQMPPTTKIFIYCFTVIAVQEFHLWCSSPFPWRLVLFWFVPLTMNVFQFTSMQLKGARPCENLQPELLSTRAIVLFCKSCENCMRKHSNASRLASGHCQLFRARFELYFICFSPHVMQDFCKLNYSTQVQFLCR